MPAVFEKLGIRFLYPENWTLDEDEGVKGGNSVSVYSPLGGFWSIAVHPPEIDPQELADTALNAMKQVYAEAEAEPVIENVDGKELSGFDLNFYCLDLTNTALIRSFRTENASCIVLCQAEDHEFASVEQVFRAMTKSLFASPA